jgi:hypothetical protein
MFLGLLDPDPLVRVTDPDQYPSKPSNKNSKQNLDSYCFATSLYFLSLKNYVNVQDQTLNADRIWTHLV